MRERPIIMSGESVRAILDGRKSQTRRVVKVLARNGGGTPTEHYTASGRAGWFDIGDEGRIMYGALFKGPNGGDLFVDSPYGQPGDRLWVRETWSAEFEWPSGDGCPWLNYWHEMPVGFRGVKNAMRVYYRADWAEYDLNKYDDDGAEFSLDFNAHVDESQLVEYDDDRPLPFRWNPSIHMPRWSSRIALELTSVRVERVQDISNADAIAEGCVGGPDVEGYSLDNPADPYEEYAVLWDALNAKRGYDWNANPWVWVLEFRKVDARAVRTGGET